MLTLPPVGVPTAVEKFTAPRTAILALVLDSDGDGDAGGGIFNMPTVGMGIGAVWRDGGPDIQKMRVRVELSHHEPEEKIISLRHQSRPWQPKASDAEGNIKGVIFSGARV